MDLLRLDNGALMSQTKSADSRLVTSDVRVANPLFAHLTSKGSISSQESTDSCVQRMILGRADMFKDTQDKKAVAISKCSETAAPVTGFHVNDEYCTTVLKQQAVEKCVNGVGSAGCSALRQTGCSTAASVAAAGIYQPTVKNVAGVQHCTSVSQMSLKKSWNYLCEWFLKK